MKILSLDCSGLVASVAVTDGYKTIAEYTTNFKKTHSQTLLPMINELLQLIEMSTADMDYIACASGPGSFTGLRIGAATAKALAHASGKKIISVPTLDALAYNVWCTDLERPACVTIPLMDARRNQVYTAFYTWIDGRLTRLTDYMAEDISIILNRPELSDCHAVFLGDGVEVYKNAIEASACRHSFAPCGLNMQRAACVGGLAHQYLNENTALIFDYHTFAPFYLRVSQAEREKMEREAK